MEIFGLHASKLSFPKFLDIVQGFARRHIELIRLPAALPKSKTLSARCFAVAGPFVVRFKHGNSINQESANF